MFFSADKELARVRGRFVQKVSKALLKQLLDDLLGDGLLNDGETDSVLEDNSNKADMARALIDMVKRKGDTASRKMIAYLESRDPTLYSELGLSCGPPVKPPGELMSRSSGYVTVCPVIPTAAVVVLCFFFQLQIWFGHLSSSPPRMRFGRRN